MARAKGDDSVLDYCDYAGPALGEYTQVEVKIRKRNSEYMRLSGKKILVVGLGESGLAVAHWLVGQGSRVTVSEQQKESSLDKDVIKDSLESGIKLECGGHEIKTFLESDLIVVSPGVPLDIKPLAEARKGGVPIIGEVELASRYLETPAIAVTGTNGKSTVVELIGDMLLKGGSSVFVGGNIGRPLTRYLEGEQSAGYRVEQLST
jgi:UDP-N-acetylmuramoylalanine--D-glutamate ligase